MGGLSADPGEEGSECGLWGRKEGYFSSARLDDLGEESGFFSFFHEPR